MLKGMATAWRNGFGQSFPFLVVQLAAYASTDPTPATRDADTTVALRKAQSAAVRALSRSGLALAVDLGDDGVEPYTPPTSRHGGIHPRNKTEVARRLALTYVSMQTGIGASANISSGPSATLGPIPLAVQVQTNGTVHVTFSASDPSSSGLALVPTAQCHSHGQLPADANCCTQDITGNPQGMPFEVRLRDGSFHIVEARVLQDASLVELSAIPNIAVIDVAGVRYGFQGYPLCVLSNAAGLPADMFERECDHEPE